MDRFVFFGGKGGVGKTTVASAYGVQCARGGQQTLLVSTDPAHSTSDVFDQGFDDEPAPVEGYDGLSAMELDPDAEVERHMREIKQAMSDQVSPAIVNELDRQIELAHRTPGAYEAALFDRFIDVMRSSDDYDRVVFDTSPTGGTLRLLALPELLESWVDRLRQKRAESVDLFEKAAIGDREARATLEDDPIVRRLAERAETFDFAGRVLSEQATFFLVLNPDDLSIAESQRAIEDLREADLSVGGLVVNKVAPAPGESETGIGATYLRERRRAEQARLDRIHESFDQPVVAVLEQRAGVDGTDLLADLVADLALGTAVEPPAT
ncbi:ArsA family ATPase [Haloarcula salinisoli]|uniref:ArsA family ATPase n=1 Tax=Haloarcula salinisoli TaxID=2487746 RepID=A0A8J7YJI7_9EURY|nr:ArsA family ATPase [Halomicroarcula salinisoli]MBX0286134.1 ArsA family ATPase [Halomicroarcula salinisoli]MBX0302378.1 ArsA family ATPase [Halomicroarcula salinisoli]